MYKYVRPEDLTEVERELDKALDRLVESREILQELYDQGEEKLDNMPESAEGSDELEHLSDRLGSIEDAIGYIDAAETRVDDAIPEVRA